MMYLTDSTILVVLMILIDFDDSNVATSSTMLRNLMISIPGNTNTNNNFCTPDNTRPLSPGLSLQRRPAA